MRRRLLCLLPLLWLAACSTLPPPAPMPEGGPSAPLLQHWSIQGKLGVRQQQRADSATLNWQQHEQAYQIRLSGPLGQGALTLNGTPQRVEMLGAGDDAPLVARTPEALMQAQLGWSLPLSQAHYWVQGRPAPEFPFSALPGKTGFNQLGWQIEILQLGQFNYAGTPVSLPTRLRLQYGDLRITLLIAQWTLEQ